LRPTDFLRRLPNAVRRDLPQDLAASFHGASRFSLAQLWSGNRAIHYEAWIRSRAGAVEIGLHFEADPLTNARLLAAFRAHERALHDALGEEARIEEWDRGWSRVWEPIELATLDDAFLERVAARLAGYVNALEPILREELPADVLWAEPRRRPARPQRAATGTRAKQRR
jgi:hypothetical protein